MISHHLYNAYVGMYIYPLMMEEKSYIISRLATNYLVLVMQLLKKVMPHTSGEIDDIGNKDLHIYGSGPMD